MYLVCGSQVSVTVPDGSLPSGTMICAGPLAAPVVACPGEAALEELADGVEFEPHAPTIAAMTAAPITIGNALDLVEFVSTMMLRLPVTRSPLSAKAVDALRVRDPVSPRDEIVRDVRN
jgi:hypothetical protein